MSDALFSVAAAGPHVSIQDGGRPGLMRWGVPASGPLDRFAFALANRALGNAEGAAGLEVSLGGLALDCLEGAVTLAVAGGGFRLRHGERDGPVWRVLTLAAGERLVVSDGFWGAWCYIAFAGSLAAPDWLGSQATHGPSGLGGGRLAAGALLSIEGAERRPRREGDLPLPVPARPRPSFAVLPGPQARHFPPAALATLLTAPYALSDAYDRMGVRLAGPRLVPTDGLSLPSQAVVRGSIQVSGDGVPTVLFADHQTTGGYPKIATLVSSETDAFVQLRPRERLRFHAVGPDGAVSLARAAARTRAGVLAAVDRDR